MSAQHLLKHLQAALVAGLALLASGCATPAGQGPPPATPGTVPATAPSPATAQPSLAPTAPVLSANPVVTPTGAAGPVSPPAAAPASGSGVVFTLVPDGSEARFHAREQLVGRSLPNEAVGRTRAVTGSIALDAAGAVVPDESRITVDLRTLRSDESRRDNYIQRSTLQTERFPTAEFVPRETRGLPAPLPTEATFQLLGDLTVHGVTRPAVWEVTARATGPEVTGTASTQVKITDFDMALPRAGPVLSIEDALRLELDFRAMSSAGASPGPEGSDG